MMRRLLCVAVLLLPCAAGAGQRAANAARAGSGRADALPRDPKALLALGARSDGLALSGLRNWTITIDYQLYDAQGLRTQAGVFQEWWAGPDDYRMRFSRPGYHLDAWVTPKGSYSIGDPNLPMAERLVYRWMMEPIPPEMDTDGYELWRRVMLLPNSLQFPCVVMNLAHAAPEDPDPINPQYCFDSSQPVLRMADTEDGERIVYRALAALRSQYLPGEFVARVGRMPFLSARLVGGRIYAKLPEGVLTPPEQAVPGPRPETAVLYMSTGHALDAHAISRPMLSQAAINSRMENGMESLAYAVTIGTDGKMSDVRVIGDNAPEIVDMVTKELKQWRFRPFVAGGVAVPVRARIWLNFEKQLGE
uniref:TonB C-terminal domain-containing protein n=1 Tax=Acidobacterium capsulatum TaxID=33075 RepID=A0A7V5CU60_9BACT